MIKRLLILLQFTLVCTVFAQSYVGLSKPLLMKNTAIDTCASKYAKAGIKAVIDSSFLNHNNSLSIIRTQQLDSNGGVVSINEYDVNSKQTTFTLYTINDQKKIIKFREYEKQPGQKDCTLVLTEEVLQTDNLGRPVLVVVSRPLKTTRQSLVPYFYSEVLKDVVKTKGVLYYHSWEMHKIYSTYTYYGDTLVKEYQKRIVGRDTVERVEILYDKDKMEMQATYWVQLNAQTKGVSVFRYNRLIETQTWISGKKTEHSSYTYAPRANGFMANSKYEVFSLMTGSPVLKFFISEGLGGTHEITPAGKPMYIYQEDEAVAIVSQELLDNLEEDIKSGFAVPTVSVDGNLLKKEYRKRSKVVFTICSDKSGLVVAYSDQFSKTRRSYIR